MALVSGALVLLFLVWWSVFDSHQDGDVGGPDVEDVSNQQLIDSTRGSALFRVGVVVLLGLASCACWSLVSVHREDENNRVRVVRGDSDLDKMAGEEEGEQRDVELQPLSMEQREWAERAIGRSAQQQQEEDAKEEDNTEEEEEEEAS